jgi:Family of unknown function (DUF6113)
MPARRSALPIGGPAIGGREDRSAIQRPGASKGWGGDVLVTVENGEPSDERTLSWLLRTLDLVVLSACAALSAMLAALLVPLRWGTVIVPVSVLIAVASTAGLIVLAWRAVRSVALAAIPFAIWVVTVLVLSQARPEGDVVLPGGQTGVVYVVYATMLGGFVAGLATIFILSSSRRVTPAGRR